MSRTIQIYFKTLKLEQKFQLVGFSTFAFFSFSNCFVRSLLLALFSFFFRLQSPMVVGSSHSPERMPTPLLCFPTPQRVAVASSGG
jgi:hypothetical protein